MFYIVCFPRHISTFSIYSDLFRPSVEIFGFSEMSCFIYHRRSGLVVKYNVSLKKLLQHGISEAEFYDALLYRIRKKCGEIEFFGTVQKAY